MGIERIEQSVGYLKSLEIKRSGNFGHGGRPGKVGGSVPKGGMSTGGGKKKPTKTSTPQNYGKASKMIGALDKLATNTDLDAHYDVHDNIASNIFKLMGGEKVGDFNASMPRKEKQLVVTNYGGEKFDYSKGFKVEALAKAGFVKKASNFRRKDYSTYILKSPNSKIEITASSKDYNIDVGSTYKGSIH